MSIFTRRRRFTYAFVFATDMYKTVFQEDPLDPVRGRRYRDTILLPGGSRDEIDLLKVGCSCAIHSRIRVHVLNVSLGFPWSPTQFGSFH